MRLDIDVRFTDGSYTQLGRGHAEIQTNNDEHAQLEATVSLAQITREEKEARP